MKNKNDLLSSIYYLRIQALRVIKDCLTSPDPPQMVKLEAAKYVINLCLQYCITLQEFEENQAVEIINQNVFVKKDAID